MADNVLLEIVPEFIDHFLKGKNLPEVATTTATVAKSILAKVQTLKENAFNNKLKIFLIETAKTSDKERLDFSKRLGEKPEKFWEELILQIESIENEEKVLITSKLSHSLILKYIDFEQLSRLNLILKNVHYNDLEYLHINFESVVDGHNNNSGFVPYDLDKKGKVIVDSLVKNGLLKERAGSDVMQLALKSRLGYDVTELGGTLIKYGF